MGSGMNESVTSGRNKSVNMGEGNRKTFTKRPSMMTSQEMLEEEHIQITRKNNIKHAVDSDDDGQIIQVSSVGTIGESDTKIFSIKFDAEDKYIAAACENGQVRVYNTNTMALAYTITNDLNSPFSYLKWRPVNTFNKTKNVFVTTNAEGQI